MNSSLTAILLASLAGIPATTARSWCGGLRCPPDSPTPTSQVGQAQASPKVEVVFVLDTTGSMGGLIDGAKQKIWSIANQIVSADPRPTVRMGLVGYRDRGDEYITKLSPLTDDLDAVYSTLMGFRADGGGDGPESVNQALHEAVTKFEWESSNSALKLIYLVGDFPPHMDYQDDMKYQHSCEIAASRGITINTIQCGTEATATPIWQEIARLSEGEFFAVDQSGGAVATATPFDAELASLGTKLESTVVAYGSVADQRAQTDRTEVAQRVAAAAPREALAERAAYKAAGGTSLSGMKDLVDDAGRGRLEVSNVPEGDLPPEMQRMDEKERRLFVEKKITDRRELQTRIQDLAAKRSEYLEQQRHSQGPVADSFDRAILDSLRKQGAAKGIRYAPPLQPLGR